MNKLAAESSRRTEFDKKRCRVELDVSRKVEFDVTRKVEFDVTRKVEFDITSKT